jgi:L-lysine exporter family protein LysE/ArgO
MLVPFFFGGTMKEVFLEGMLLQASLIFALGPQNLFVLESGFRKQHHVVVSLVCFLCDLCLIMLGVMGASTFFNFFPQFKVIIGGIGVAFLVVYGVGKILVDTDVDTRTAYKGSGIKNAVLSSITFSILNPHAYLDGIILIGGYSSKYLDLSLRLALGAGASTFSLIWFLLLSYGSATMMPMFADPRRMRLVMSTAGVILLFLSARLSMDVIGWLQEIYPETASTLSLTRE